MLFITVYTLIDIIDIAALSLPVFTTYYPSAPSDLYYWHLCKVSRGAWALYYLKLYLIIFTSARRYDSLCRRLPHYCILCTLAQRKKFNFYTTGVLFLQLWPSVLSVMKPISLQRNLEMQQQQKQQLQFRLTGVHTSRKVLLPLTAAGFLVLVTENLLNITNNMHERY